jgi:Fe-S oxidoreductase
MAKEKVSVWLGCTTRTYLKNTIESLDKIMSHLKINYSIIESKQGKGDLELCCGSVLLGTGHRRKAIKNLKAVEKYLNAQKVRNMVALCPGCARTFINFYLPRKTNGLESVEHISETFQNHLSDFEFRPKRPRKVTRVTYHDPCHLGRHMGIYEPPRAVLRALPGVELVEIAKTRSESYCCGSGGGVRAYNRDLADDTSRNRVREALEADAQYLVTACPFCERSLRTAVELENQERNLKVINLVDFVAMFIK